MHFRMTEIAEDLFLAEQNHTWHITVISMLNALTYFKGMSLYVLRD